MQKLRLLKLFILLTCILNNTNALEVNSKNLKILVEQKNLNVLSSQLYIQAAKEREGVLLRSFLPSVKLSASQERFKTGLDRYRTQPAYGIEGALNLYNGGQDGFESNIRKISSELQSTKAQQVLNLELQKIRSLYWEILYLQNKVSLLNDAMETNRSNTSAALKRINSGVATNTDKLEFDMEAVNLKRELDHIDIQLKNNMNLLLVLLNLDKSEKIEFKEELVHEHEIDSILSEQSQKFNFQYKDLELQSKINTMNADKEKRSLWPKIDAFASYFQFNQREKDFISNIDRDEYAFGIKITLDIPSGFESNREAASYSYLAKSADAQATMQKRVVETHIKNELSELNFLHEQVHSADENIKRAQSYYKSTQSEYSRGVKNSPDVLAASQRLFEMRHKRLEILRDFQISKGHLLSQLGQ